MTVIELKIALYPDISPKKVQLLCDEEELLDDFQPLSDILIQKPQIFYILTSFTDDGSPPSIFTHTTSSSGQSFTFNENEWIFHFE
jgi:hypothetical protein